MGDAAFEIGLDEAGYGPLLGPLVVGAVRIDGPAGSLAAARRSGVPALPRIDDSKRLFQGGRGFATLETAALAALTLARGRRPRRVADAFDGPPDRLDAHGWYGVLDAPLPRKADVGRVEAAAEALGRALSDVGASLARAAAHVRLEGELNAAFARHGNKGAAHLEFMGAALVLALDGVRDAAAGRITCDRLGGRKDYGPFLARLFPFRPLRVVEARDDVSAYVVRPRDADVAVRFVVDGETASPETALASCLAKYARELLMESFNSGFAALAPGLAPTAGYVEDGRRFLSDLVRLSGDSAWIARLSRSR